jgi:histidine triad (HIT) family protein
MHDVDCEAESTAAARVHPDTDHRPLTTDHCMACRTAAGECAADEVYRDDQVVVVVSQHGMNPGHLVVVSLEHVRNALTMDDALFVHMHRVAREMALLLRRSMPDAGIMLAFNNEPPCQTVFHAHLHVVPRYPGDEMDRKFGEAVTDEERAAMAARLRPFAQREGE